MNARSFGTKLTVCSLIDVAAWTMEITSPTTSIKMSGGPAMIMMTQSAWPIETEKGLSVYNSPPPVTGRSEEHTSELQSLMRISYAVFSLKKKNTQSMCT